MLSEHGTTETAKLLLFVVRKPHRDGFMNGQDLGIHSMLLVQRIPIVEVAYLEELARARIFEFAFIGGSLKWRGASAAPFRSVALSVRHDVQ